MPRTVCVPPIVVRCLSLDGKALRANRFRLLVGAGGDAEEMNTARDFVVVDVETSGFDPAAARVLSVAALTITAGGAIEHSMFKTVDRSRLRSCEASVGTVERGDPTMSGRCPACPSPLRVSGLW